MTLITAADLRKMLRVGSTKLNSIVRQPDFPQTVKLDQADKKRRWRASDIDAWLASR